MVLELVLNRNRVKGLIREIQRRARIGMVLNIYRIVASSPSDILQPLRPLPSIEYFLLYLRAYKNCIYMPMYLFKRIQCQRNIQYLALELLSTEIR